jgi:hypothetical protein
VGAHRGAQENGDRLAEPLRGATVAKSPLEESPIMPKAKEPRETAEEKFERVRRTVAKETDDELAKVRKKTARLKALREEKAAADRAEAAKAPAPSRKRPRA